MGKTIGTLYTEGRLIAKTVNRLDVEPGNINLSAWRAEAKLLCSPSGDCLSSTTLLVKGEHVPTYGIDGRCYGLLLNAEECAIYDVSPRDANTHRDVKLARRAARRDINFLTSNTDGYKTLDELSAEIRATQGGELNEVLLDAPKQALAGLFVRKIDLETASPDTLKSYYLAMLEVKLIQKYLNQSFGFPEDLKVCQYDERAGKIFNFPDDANLLIQARMCGVTKENYPELFRQLDSSFKFPPFTYPPKLGEYLSTHLSRSGESAVATPDAAREKTTRDILEMLLEEYKPIDGRQMTMNTLQEEYVDSILGVSESMITEILERHEQQAASIQEHLAPSLARRLTLGFLAPERAARTNTDRESQTAAAAAQAPEATPSPKQS